MGTDTCCHCGSRIVLMNYSMGPKWTHQAEGAAFHDGVHEYCYVTRAEPRALAEKGTDQ